MNQTEEPATPAKSSPENKPAASKQRSRPIPNRSGNSRPAGARPRRQAANRQPARDANAATESVNDSESESVAEDTEATIPADEPEAVAESGSGIDLSPEIQRAEALLDELGHRAGGQLTDLARALFRTAVRAREEAEDIWAEANSIRRGH